MSGAAPMPVVEERTPASVQLAAGGGGEQALATARGASGLHPLKLPPSLALISLELDVAVPVRGFRLRDLIGLNQGQVIETQWDAGGDLPLAAGKVQLAWTEFDVVDMRLAVRITRLA